MYGIVEINGHQYKVQAGDVIDVDRLDNEVNDTVTFENVVFAGGDTPTVGTPTIKGAKVSAKVVRQARSRKQIVLKRKPGKSQTKNGHRTHYTALLITEVDGGNGNVSKIDKNDKNAKKYL